MRLLTGSLTRALWARFFLAILLFTARIWAQEWTRHTIDASSRGADGVRPIELAGHADWRAISVGWEEGGLQRVYLRPGPDQVRQPWPAVTVGRQASPEDAVLVDLDGDGATDVVSSCEGRTRSIFVHWAPSKPREFLDSSKWTTEAFPATQNMTRWMYALPVQVDGEHGVDLIVGAKDSQATIGWLQAPPNPRDLAAWRYHAICPAGWVMSLVADDLDADGDVDLLVSDRRGPGRGVFWLEHPGVEQLGVTSWARHRIGSEDCEILFLAYADLDRDGQRDVLVATHKQGIRLHRRTQAVGDRWTTREIPAPESIIHGKAVAVGDIDLDGQSDIVLSSETHSRPGNGIVWIAGNAIGLAKIRAGNVHAISGDAGQKFDLVQLVDLDSDGDLDVMTTEERENLGVIWYENPHL